MKYKFIITEKEDYDYCAVGYQEISNEEGKRLFSVCNLTECPEDAIIGRDLFDAEDYIRAVRFGMELAKAGYDDIEDVWLEVEDDE